MAHDPGRLPLTHSRQHLQTDPSARPVQKISPIASASVFAIGVLERAGAATVS